VILAMCTARRHSGKGASRHTTPATRPPSGGGVPGYSPRKGGLAGTRGYAGKAGGTALQRAQDRPNPFVVDEALQGIWHIERDEKAISPSMKATFSLGQGPGYTGNGDSVFAWGSPSSTAFALKASMA
jgi:hypothetical protein